MPFKQHLCLCLLVFLFTGKNVLAQNKLFGSVEIEPKRYIDETEVTVGKWMIYYIWVLDHIGNNQATKLLPDSNCLDPVLSKYFRSKSKEYYHTRLIRMQSHQPSIAELEDQSIYLSLDKRLLPENNNELLLYLPLNCITYEQALSYCEWKSNLFGKDSMIYCLPTTNEWTIAAERTMTEDEKIKGLKDSMCVKKRKSYAQFNFRNSSTYLMDGFTYKVNIISSFQEKNNIYDLFGNLSEMTATKGISKGGNFMLFANQSHLDSSQYYVKPEIWLGFRCIVVPIQRKKKNHEDSVYKSNASSDRSRNEIVDSRDGKKYRIIQIGAQIWMAENLAYKPTDLENYWAYENDERYVSQFGYLYSWETACHVCPIGWHLPTKEEFSNLINVAGNGKNAYLNLLINGKLGFDIISSGLGEGRNFTLIEGGTAFWTSTLNEKRKDEAWGVGVGMEAQNIRLNYNYAKKSGLQVRCIKN